MKLGEFVSGSTVALLGADSVVLADIMGSGQPGTVYPGLLRTLQAFHVIQMIVSSDL